MKIPRKTPGRLPCTVGLAGLVAATVIVGPAPADELDEVWIGGWTTHNVIRVDWRTGEFLGAFIPNGHGDLVEAHDFSFGADRDFYVASHGNSTVRRYDGETGEFLDVFVPFGDGLIRSHSAFWNPADGTMLVSSEFGDRVNQYDVNGSFLRAFVAPSESGLQGPEFLTTGPDGFIYLAAQSNQVLKLDPENGGVVDCFVCDDPETPEDETGGLSWGHDLTFGPDGNLYVSSSNTNRVLRYDGATGAFIDIFVGSAGAPQFPIGIGFGPDGHLYVAAFGTSQLRRYNGTTGAFLGVVANLELMGLTGPLGIRFFAGPVCRTDLDDNGTVEVADLLRLLSAWGTCEPSCPEDLDRNGVVEVADLLALLLRWGDCD